MNNEEFKILECTTEKIRVNREPQNDDELNMMRTAAMDAQVMAMLQNPPSNIVFPD